MTILREAYEQLYGKIIEPHAQEVIRKKEEVVVSPHVPNSENNDEEVFQGNINRDG